MTLTKQQIKDVADFKLEEVSVPEWGGSLFVKNMTGKERDSWEFEMLAQRNMLEKMGLPFSMDNLRAKLCVRTCCDAQGNLIFDKTDIEWLGNKNSAALDRVYEVAQRLNNLSKQDIEALRKNSQASPSDASGSV